MIPVNAPLISEDSKRNVMEALDTGWISSAGKYVTQFEEGFAQYLGVAHATTVSNGTAALHLALAALNISEGDEVIIPDMTIASCGFAVRYVGATPVFVPVQKDTGNIDPEALSAALSPRTKAIMVVHLYGHPADMDAITAFAQQHNLLVIEDAAEAHGATYQGKKAGSFGDVACFSFYGNKILTTGEGGMIVTNRQDVIDRARLLKDLAHKPGQRFFHEELGFNFRLTNLQAALGVGELSHLEEYIERKRRMAALYNELLAGIPGLVLPTERPGVRSVYWMYNIVLGDEISLSREDFMAKLKEQGIDTRTYFYPLHELPVFAGVSRTVGDTSTADMLSRRGLYLPSGLALTESEIRQVSESVRSILA